MLDVEILGPQTEEYWLGEAVVTPSDCASDLEVPACLASGPAPSGWGTMWSQSGFSKLSDRPDRDVGVPRWMGEKAHREDLNHQRRVNVNDHEY